MSVDVWSGIASPAAPAPIGGESLADALSEGVVILDGGLSTQLEAMGHDISGRLWSARMLYDDPAAVTAAHGAFFEAGAQVATTASYQASFEGFAALGLDRVQATGLLRRSVAMAREAAERVRNQDRRWVAASVGPYGAILAGGEEYTGAYTDPQWSGRRGGGLTVAELVDFHVSRMSALAAAGPDVFAVETIPALAEVEAVVTALDEVGLPSWVSLTTSLDGAGVVRTCRGEDAREAFTMLGESPHVIAVGVNCVDPRGVAAAVGVAIESAGLPGVAYPNSGEVWDARERVWHRGAAPARPESLAWVTAGARLVGGCCRVGPEDIAALASIHRPLR